ncbi:MAG TPA: hypothetical protein VM901_00790 [Bdellovibrionota bacterium]|jgi:hypothetical protein|nr:hypothetical protein [Bdellovibrionota bacterium]
MKKTFLRLCAVGTLLAASSGAMAMSTLSLQGGYGMTDSTTFEGGIAGGAVLETRFGKMLGLGVFFHYQKIAPQGMFSSLTASTMPLGAQLNFHLAPSFYIGANGGAYKITMSGGSFTSSGYDNFVGGQAGIMFGNFGVEGRYLYSLAEGGLNIMQAFAQYRIGF